MTAAVIEQGMLELFTEPYKRPSLLGVFGLTYCGCCDKTIAGYDAIHGGHNCCHGRNPRGLGCECMAMQLTLNHVHYQLREMGHPSEYTRTNKCHCAGKSHPNTAEHQADRLANYYLPRVFTVWPARRHAALRTYIDALATYWGVADLVRGDS